jgi:hypothetical protein
VRCCYAPTDHGFGTELWTLKRVCVLIERLDGLKFGQTQIWHILGGLGSRWARLAALAPNYVGPKHLESPGEFEARIRAQHKRKSSFWAHVSGARQADENLPEEADE